METSFRARLKQGEALIGTIISLASPELARAAAESGFDWVFIDWEHGTLDEKDIIRILEALPPECAGVIRVPENSEAWMKKALDTGATGLIIPHINTAAEAQQAVTRSRYAPEGERSLGFTRANRYGADMPDHIKRANLEVAVIAQVEHIEGVRNIEALLNVQGLDAIFIGPFDLSASLGIPGEIKAPAVQKAIETVKKACRRKSLPVGIFTPDKDAVAGLLNEGYSLICAGIDIQLFRTAAEEVVKASKLKRKTSLFM